ncbi:hypothetical protein HF670_09650 [Acidithiobacillus thiooxidans]|uniref:Uncharacterized protein n=1 Tax=Acidithiobacillus thiooxidans TaxID=930 RepID=A0A1C2IFG1_ACITH|nr:hypothetical protein [Acidithiobacillus thiooxidans]MBU2839823.1 hypothetical protein [Acidithiobacillus thiooxidans]OCX70169.1 hypothetical protein A6O24_16705 [Acidithiobacillus thiooxidans]OCX72494.1 hypothetical protein A6P07_09860 [Acidithiobacillus thiooxidans]OCX74728.1 hypothetical protein A6M23_05000 [Acidithiobacillus thiooxidans]OCX82207.1 hypothetical protein A6M27_19015 [Acidithiobacillus thiooxidans]
MVEKIGHIKNPLTVIAVFAAIAEISGTTVLPFVAPENQATYILFLMLFPTLLVCLFFLTLNFNHKVLYAPSDWKDESNFFRLFSKATPEEQEQKLKDEVTEEAEAEAKSTQDVPISKPILEEERKVTIATANRERVARYSLAERLVINRLSKELKLSFRSGVRFHSATYRSVIFDAVAFEGDKVNAVEVKMTRSDLFPIDRAEGFLLEAERVSNQLRDEGKDFILHYAVVLDEGAADIQQLEARLRRQLERFEMNIKLHVFAMSELVSEFERRP